MSRVKTEPRLTAERDAPLGGQAVLEGVMMRGISTWAVAVRKPEFDPDALGEIAIRRFTIDAAPAGSVCRRLYRLPVVRGRGRAGRFDGDRNAGTGDLGQRPDPARRGRRTWRGRRRDLRRRLVRDGADLARVRDRPVLRRAGRADQSDPRSARVVMAVLAGRGAAADRDLPRVSDAVVTDPRSAAGVRVPRRRAQGDLVLRGRRRARRRSTPPAIRGCIRGAARAFC